MSFLREYWICMFVSSLSAVWFILFLVLYHDVSTAQECNDGISPSTAIERINQAIDVINFTRFDARENTHANLLSRLRIRSEPNERLRTAFNIINSFTSDDPDIHQHFIEKARNIVICGSSKEALLTCRRRAVSILEHPGMWQGQGSVRITRLVRVTCLYVAFDFLFPTGSDRRPIDIDRADRIAELINLLWLKSKDDPAVHQRPSVKTQCANLAELETNLRMLLPCEKTEDILSVIIPAYETLWRVVLLAFVQVKFRANSEETVQLAVRTLHALANNENHLELTLDTKLFGKEALRLFPPTKRIYRAEGFSADIESLHHDEQIWGPDALEFRPRRFEVLSPLQRKAFMPFGSKPHQCPAAGGFAYKLIPLIVACLWQHVEVKGSVGMDFRIPVLTDDESALLPTGRGDADEWLLHAV